MKCLSSYAERDYVLKSCSRYWPKGDDKIVELPIPKAQKAGRDQYPPVGKEVQLPEWGVSAGVEGKLWVPDYTSIPGAEEQWKRIDWIEAIFWYLHNAAERARERVQGTVHSYSFRLAGWESRFWERAWVNRIALFLRRWVAFEHRRLEEDIFGPIPRACVLITHDVDAVAKTLPIRGKQAAFHLFNASRQLLSGRLRNGAQLLKRACLFGFGAASYWRFPEIMNLERQYNIRSHFNFYGGVGGWRRSPKEILFDPSYCVTEPRLSGVIRELNGNGWKIGLHQSFNAWADPQLMQTELRCLEAVTGEGVVTSCRQHWLRFSFESTWRVQQEVGLRLDTTLGFNDRPGFRNGAALKFCPWDSAREAPLALEAMPMIFMDSHFYDYRNMGESTRRQSMARWIREVKEVGGEATVIWHQRVLSPDYGWREGFENLLTLVHDSCELG